MELVPVEQADLQDPIPRTFPASEWRSNWSGAGMLDAHPSPHLRLSHPFTVEYLTSCRILTLGRMAGARYATWNGSGLDIHNDPDECWYDAEGRMFNPCDEAAPILAYEGDNATRTGGGYWWRFFHAPGLDNPVLMVYRSGAYLERELYLMTDGSGRQLAVGDSTGYIDTDDLHELTPNLDPAIAGHSQVAGQVSARG